MTEIEQQISSYLARHGWDVYRREGKPRGMYQCQKAIYRINLKTYAKVDAQLVAQAYAETLNQIENAAYAITSLGAPHDVTGNVISNEHCHLFRYTLRFPQER